VPRILVVGAGFVGATYARELAEHGYQVDVIDKRPHVADNDNDKTSGSGVRVLRYGPHWFRINSASVIQWLTRFGAFVPFEHRVSAAPGSGVFVPLPINRQTINTVFHRRQCDARNLRGVPYGLAVPGMAPRNAAEYLTSQIDETLTDLFFRHHSGTLRLHRGSTGTSLSGADPRRNLFPISGIR
jgi:UDP-galactopyranose mutase